MGGWDDEKMGHMVFPFIGVEEDGGGDGAREDFNDSCGIRRIVARERGRRAKAGMADGGDKDAHVRAGKGDKNSGG